MLTGVHFILIFLGLDLSQTKKFLVETEDLEKGGRAAFREGFDKDRVD